MKHMSKLADFIKKYDTVIFDMDGVITSEENYWNSSALTVYELFNSADYWGGNKIDVNYIMDNYRDMRKYLFKNDSLISLLKNKGVNSNWDLTYVVMCISIILNTPNPDEIYEYAYTLGDNILGEYDSLAIKTAEKLNKPLEYCKRNGDMWQLAFNCFQEWFLGDTLYKKIYGKYPKKQGKTGLVYNEEPIIELEKLQDIFYMLHKNNIRVCMGTGRPSAEIIPPLEKWGIKQYMSQDSLINYDHVVNAERSFAGQHFTKPHPYMFLKAMLGENYSDKQIINNDFPHELIKKTLVVGDAGADIFAAQAMGADFCAVLTGIQGQKARAFFEGQKAQYILNSIEDFLV